MGAVRFDVEYRGVRIPVIFEEDRRLPLASMELVFEGAGANSDTIPGVASLSASLLGEGSAKEGAEAFAEALERRAVTLDASVGRETMVVSMEALKSEFPFAISKLRELLSSPNYSEDAFSRVKKRRLGELERRRSDFDYVASVGLREVLFSGTPLAHPRLGDEKSVEKIELENLKEYIESHIYLDNLIVVMGGDFDREEAKSVVLEAISVLERGTPPKNLTYEARDINETKIVHEKSDQSYIYFGAPYHMSPDDENRTLGKVAAFILGSGGFGSRMMEKIRVEKGLAYSAYARFSVNRSGSYMSGYLQTKLESGDEAVALVKSIVKEFVEKGVSRDELESARKFFLGSEPLRMETLAQRMNRAFHEYYDGLGLGYYEKELKKISSIGLDEINSFISSHREIESMSWFIVTGSGDRGEKR
jgi:predicted Zn-dependent peptidase